MVKSPFCCFLIPCRKRYDGARSGSLAFASEAYDALRAAAFDTIARPVPDEDVLRAVERALEHRNLVRDNARNLYRIS